MKFPLKSIVRHFPKNQFKTVFWNCGVIVQSHLNPSIRFYVCEKENGWCVQNLQTYIATHSSSIVETRRRIDWLVSKSTVS